MAGKRSVLLVEDVVSQVSSTVFRLEDELECRVVAVVSVEAALEKLSQERFDVIIVDVKIPIVEHGEFRDFGGVELVDRLHRMPDDHLNLLTPYIFLTAQQRSLIGGGPVADKRCLGLVKKLNQSAAVEIIRSYFEIRMPVGVESAKR